MWDTMTKLELPKQSIQWLVACFHVSTSDDEIRAEIRKHCTSTDWTPARILAAEKFAVKCHRKNQDLYHAVMTGRLETQK